jgi:hypothetical protein
MDTLHRNYHTIEHKRSVKGFLVKKKKQLERDRKLKVRPKIKLKLENQLN